jgi:CRP-like cAMP-binding protein
MPSNNRPELQAFLNRLTKRSILSRDEQEAILNLRGKVEHVQAGLDFVPLNKRTDYACLITAGLVGRFGQNSDGERQITAIHIPGDMPDLATVVQPASGAPLQALSIASILRVPHSALRDATSRYPALAEAMWRDCMVDANILAQWVVNVGRRDAKTRMAHLLCEMAVRLRAAPAKGEVMFPFAVSQTQLGDATGLTSVHVNRTLKSLREAGLAEVSSRAVRVPNWDALAEAGEFDATYLQEDVKPDERPRIIDGYLTST